MSILVIYYGIAVGGRKERIDEHEDLKMASRRGVSDERPQQITIYRLYIRGTSIITNVISRGKVMG